MAEISTVIYTPNEIMALAPGASDADYIRLNGMLAMGQNLLKGTLLGVVAATGKLKAYDDAHSDGTEIAVGVLDRDLDATLRDKPCTYFVRGYFYEERLVGLDAAAKADLQARSLPTGIITIP